MAIHIQRNLLRNNFYELKVGALLTDMLQPWPAGSQTIHEAKTAFENGLREIPQKSGLSAAMCYKAVMSPDYKRLDIVHLNIEGTPDRTLAVITNA